MFGMGLFKKVVLADSIAPFAKPVFDGAAAGIAIDSATAWVGSICYALQLYFDFSGYSDMAIGLGTIFAIKLPLNFDSPFKATNISDFWRRWHMTMTRFFTNYVYSGLGHERHAQGHAHAARHSRALHAGRSLPVIDHLPGRRRLARLRLDLCCLWRDARRCHRDLLAWREFSPVKLAGAGCLGRHHVDGCLRPGDVPRADVTTAFTILGHMWGLSTSAADATFADHRQRPGAFDDRAPRCHHAAAAQHPANPAPRLAGRSTPSQKTAAWMPALWPGAQRSAPHSSAPALFTIAITSIGSSSGFLYYKF